jgi:hypothetical protein
MLFFLITERDDMGNMQFDRQTLISAVTNKSVKTISFTSTQSLGPNTYERHIIFSPPNTISRLINVRLQWDPLQNGTYTGTRSLIIDNYIDANNGIGIFRGTSDKLYKAFVFDQGDFQIMPDMIHDSTLQMFPNDLAAVNNNIRNFYFDETTGISIVFFHTIAGVPVSEARNVTLFIEQEVVSR